MSAKKKTALQTASSTQSEDKVLYGRIAAILDQARSHVARSVNSAQVAANWLIGREIVEEEQSGNARAGYREGLLKQLSSRLKQAGYKACSVDNLELFRRFYLSYPQLLHLSDTACRISGQVETDAPAGNSETPRRISTTQPAKQTGQAAPDELEIFKKLNLNLSWSHYRLLMRVRKPAAREFYESECIQARWSTRELERQIGSLYYERLLMSKNRKEMILENRKPALTPHAAAALEIIKDPYVLEFLGLPEHHTLNETDLEARLVEQLKDFLMELGHGFAFIGRQQRLTLDGDHFYADLVFYHTRLKCYVVIDLKTRKLSHADLGQMQLYVNYYDEEIAAEDDNPTLGLILCTDKNEAVCRYVLGKGNQTIFTSRYQLHLPTEEQLAAELRRERALIEGGQA